MPYTYLIGWRSKDIWYYGSRWAKEARPSDLWKTYFTSSKRVKQLREELGEPDVVEVRRVFSDSATCRAWETRVIQRMGMVRSKRWLNACDGINLLYVDNTGTQRDDLRLRNLMDNPAKYPNARAKMSRNHADVSGANHPLYGRGHTAESREKMSVARRGKGTGPKSIETRAKMAEARRRYWEERRAN